MDNTSTPKIPIYTNQDNAYEADVNTGNVAIAVQERHPIDAMQRNSTSVSIDNPYQDLNYIRSVYGSGLAMEMMVERQIIQKERYEMGLRHIPSLYQDIVMGNDTTIQYTDYMNVPDSRIELPKSVFHVSMDRQLKNS